ncbi:hypothetical protein KGM_211862 [Danaus plexippus plexippus]|uniref:Uncharacterized protein n=1 Tax=Danaus plexippus plexippus TaxID=278856 RepID=A0A212EMB4_DANPL|nr:hypothetical protein KGM_211862 [Danaus plexippus plexippus]
MPTENYQIHNIYQYKRKTYKNNQNENYMNSRVDQNDLTDSPRSDRVTIDEAGCSCDLDSDGEIANILSKKRPVIELAQLQLQRVLDETDNLFCDNIDCCSKTPNGIGGLGDLNSYRQNDFQLEFRLLGHVPQSPEGVDG